MPRKCPAFGKKCAKCDLTGHFAVMCKTRNAKGKQKNKKVNKLQLEIQKEEETELCIFKSDSGAQCNVLPLNLAKKINAKIGDNNTKNLVSYSGHKIKVVGEIDAPCQINDVKAVINCKIIDENQFPILEYVINQA
ncbi:hypothetical protein QE152_g23450 [Popillia japonica]|uniref:Uncharacterized protein n=1 Tax=Popillia japonica TaxID=7064 RepID=A0AAW1KEZ5_POPJA